MEQTNFNILIVETTILMNGMLCLPFCFLRVLGIMVYDISRG